MTSSKENLQAFEKICKDLSISEKRVRELIGAAKCDDYFKKVHLNPDTIKQYIDFTLIYDEVTQYINEIATKLVAKPERRSDYEMFKKIILYISTLNQHFVKSTLRDLEKKEFEETILKKDAEIVLYLKEIKRLKDELEF